MVFLKYDGCNPIDPKTGSFAPIPGDADIGGVGVMIAFIITAWTTILASTMASLRNWEKIKSPRFIKFALGAEDLLGPMCDLQAITGAAIVIAGFSQWQTITFYHRDLVESYWYLTSNSFWSARRSYMYGAIESSKSPVSTHSVKRAVTSGTSTATAPTGAGHNAATAIKKAEAIKSWTAWQVYTRRGFIVISVALGLAWSASSNILENREWDESDPNRCYDYNDATYNEQGIYYNGVMLVGLLFYLVSLLLSFVDRQGKTAKSYHVLFENILEIPENKLCAHVEAVRRQNGVFHLANRKLWLAALWGLAYWTVRVIRGIIAAWSYGDSHSPEFFLFYYMFVSWNTWDIVMLKVLNERLVDDETKVGFGQVLPLVLLTQIGLTVVGIWKDPTKIAERENECQNLIERKAHNDQGPQGHSHDVDHVTQPHG